MPAETRVSSDAATLLTLNEEYIRSVQTSDVGWFERVLVSDFRCTLPDGSVIDRERFLTRTAAPVDISDLQAHDVEVRQFGDTAIIHARTSFVAADGRHGSGRYTDVWVRLGGRWQVAAAHFTRSVD
jgi:ketosteroid isomerase-like protein